MIRTESISPLLNVETPDTWREVDPFLDPEVVRLTALNIELAVRNLIQSKDPPECLTLTADICTHLLMATPTADGDVKVTVFDK